MNTYRVEWSCMYQAENPVDAARQAWEDLNYASLNNLGATILFVTDEYGDNKESIDMESLGFCDFCNKSYLVYDIEDHCSHCGNCKEHCTDYDKEYFLKIIAASGGDNEVQN